MAKPQGTMRTPALDLAIHCGRQFSSMHLHAVLTFDRTLDFARLRRAVLLSTEAEPILRCRFVERPLRPTWEPSPAFASEDFQERLCRHIASSDPETVLSEFLAQPLDATCDPLVQVRLFDRPEGGQARVAIKLSHLVGDGAGVVTYIRLLARIYTRLGSDPTYRPEPNTRTRGEEMLTRKFSGSEKRQIVRATVAGLKRRGAITNRWGFPNPELPGLERMYLWKQIPPEQVQVLNGYARTQKATLNLVLLAAYYRALDAQIPKLGTGALPLMTTVDLRRYLSAGDREEMPLCNLSGITTLLIDQDSRTCRFGDTLACVREQMKERKANHLGLLLLPMLLALYNGLPFFLSRRIVRNDLIKNARNQKTAPVLTNGGILNPEEFVFSGAELLDLFGTASVQFSPTFVMAVTEFRRRVTLSVGFCQNLIGRAQVEAVLSHMLTELATISEEHLQLAREFSHRPQKAEIAGEG